MKRDIDLIRKILLEVEKKDSPTGWATIHFDGYSSEEVSYHVRLLAEAGYLEAINLTSKSRFDWHPVNLTWSGHEFLDAARDSTLWNKAKKHLVSKVPSVSFDVLKTLLVSYAKEALGL